MRARMASLLIVCLMTLAACSGSGAVASPSPAIATDIDPGGSPSGVAFDFGSLWVGIADKGMVSRIDPATGKVIKSITVGDPAKVLAGARNTHGVPSAVISGLGSIWAAGADGKLVRIDPSTGAVIARIPAERSPDWLTVGAGSVWVTRETPRAVLRIDPLTNAVTSAIAGDASWGLGTGIAFFD